MRLIVLTQEKNDKPIYINIEKIDYFFEGVESNTFYEGKQIVQKHTKISYGGSVSQVKETPKEIIEKIRSIKNANNTNII
jgi:hypothetical protein